MQTTGRMAARVEMSSSRAGEGIRTLDIQLGRLTLYSPNGDEHATCASVAPPTSRSTSLASLGATNVIEVQHGDSVLRLVLFTNVRARAVIAAEAGAYRG